MQTEALPTFGSARTVVQSHAVEYMNGLLGQVFENLPELSDRPEADGSESQKTPGFRFRWRELRICYNCYRNVL